VPLLFVFLFFLGMRAWFANDHKRYATMKNDELANAYQSLAPVSATGLAKLRKVDGGFSAPVLYDFLQLIHRRSYEALVTNQWHLLEPFAAKSFQNELASANTNVSEISEVVVGAIKVERVSFRGKLVQLVVDFENTRLESRDGKAQRKFVVERWTFRRDTNAVSLRPEAMLALDCPNCGNTAETNKMGSCTHCDTPITKGQLQWQAITARVLRRKNVEAPEVGFFAGGDEPSVKLPTRVDGAFGASVRAFNARHSDFDVPAFQEHTKQVFLKLQEGWSRNDWNLARPYVTDPMFQTLRFYIDRYKQQGWRNALDDVRMTKQQLVKVDMDAWYESITVRVWAKCRDYVEDKNGEIVGGNKKMDRHFSEYWTFVRAAGTGAAVHDTGSCPSCGAPLDNINQAGVCGYCDAKITTGRFDWVLSRIDQCESYPG
jgi:predicted lipid-binding transport protein (Tim44 family)